MGGCSQWTQRPPAPHSKPASWAGAPPTACSGPGLTSVGAEPLLPGGPSAWQQAGLPVGVLWSAVICLVGIPEIQTGGAGLWTCVREGPSVAPDGPARVRERKMLPRGVPLSRGLALQGGWVLSCLHPLPAPQPPPASGSRAALHVPTSSDPASRPLSVARRGLSHKPPSPPPPPRVRSWSPERREDRLRGRGHGFGGVTALGQLWDTAMVLGAVGGGQVQAVSLPSVPAWPLSSLCPSCRQTSSLLPWCTSGLRSQQVSGSQSRACFWAWKEDLWPDSTPLPPPGAPGQPRPGHGPPPRGLRVLLPAGLYLEPKLLEHTVSPSAADVLVTR